MYVVKTFRLIRLGNFFHIILGMLVVRQRLTYEDVDNFFVIFVVFGVLMYGGIYAFNNYADQKRDSKHPLKKNRVLVLGLLSAKHVLMLSFFVIMVSLVLGYTLIPQLFRLQLVLLVLNFFYSFILKNTDQLFASAVVSITHPIRFILGVVMANGDITRYWPYYLLIWSGLFSMVTYKIQYEDDTYSFWLIRSIRIFLAILFVGMFAWAVGSSPSVLVLGYYVFHYGVGAVVFNSTCSMKKIFNSYWLT